MSEFLVSLNPLNQEPVGQVPITSRSELTDIVGRSRIAQANWATGAGYRWKSVQPA